MGARFAPCVAVAKRGPDRFSAQRADSAAADRLVRELGFIAEDGAPVHAHAFHDARGALRRVELRWATGWQATVYVSAAGSTRLVSKLKFTARIGR